MNKLIAVVFFCICLSIPLAAQDVTPARTNSPRETAIAKLAKAGISYRGVSQLPDGLLNVDLGKSSVSNLAVLKGMPIAFLNISETQVKDLSPVAGMPLQMLSASKTPIKDLAPLKGLKLKYLDLNSTRVASLLPLQGMPLESLYIAETQVTDLTPLKGAPLQILIFSPRNIKDGLKIVRDMPTLKKIGADPKKDPVKASDFWKKSGKGASK